MQPDKQAPMPPEVFEPLFRDKLKFTHRTDIDAVLKAQHEVFCLYRLFCMDF